MKPKSNHANLMLLLSIPLILALLIVSTSADVSADEVAVTVYNDNLGVVSELRQLDLEKGVSQLQFRDVPSQIDANSVRFEVVGAGDQVTILEQNYAFDLVSPEQMYNKYIDETINLIDEQGRMYAGTLLSYGSGTVTLLDQSGKVKIVSLDKISDVTFPSLPEGLITRPTLFWKYQSEIAGSRQCRVGYQTGGMTWSAEYVGVLDQSETDLDLSGWSAINNTSGKTFEDAKLKLVAGDIHRAEQDFRRGRGGDMIMMEAAPKSAGFEEKAFFEYHLYTLPRPATIADKEIKQISLFEPASTTVKKIYLYEPDRDAENVKVKVEFTNSSDAGLGMPLPAGRVRMFKADDDGALILLGEDRIDHTPKDEKVDLTVGNAFDIVGEQTMVNRTRISDRVEDRQFKIELRNRKSEDVTVTVEKSLWGFWEVTSSSHEYTKKDANTVRFEVPVKGEGTVTVDLTVRFTNR